MEEKFVSVCPKCGSCEVGQLEGEWLCRRCNFRGFFFPEVREDKIEEFVKALEEQTWD